MATSPATGCDYRLHAVLFQEDGWWMAVCLEHFIAAQAKTEEALLESLQKILRGHLLLAQRAGREPFASIPSAPRRYWKMYEADEAHPHDALPVPVGADAPLQPLVELRTF